MKHMKKIGFIGLVLAMFSLFWVDASYRRNLRRTKQTTGRRRGISERTQRISQSKRQRKVVPQKLSLKERSLPRSEKKVVQEWEQYKLTPEEQSLLNSEEKRAYASILSKVIISYRLLRKEPEEDLLDALQKFKVAVKKRGERDKTESLSREERKQLEAEYTELQEAFKAGELTPEEIERMEQIQKLLSDESMEEEELEEEKVSIAEKRKINLAYKLVEEVLNNLLSKNVNVADIPQNSYSKGEAIQQLIKDGVLGQMSPAHFLSSKAKSITLILSSIQQQLQRLSQRSMNVVKKYKDYFTDQEVAHLLVKAQEVWSQFEPSIDYEKQEGFFSYAVLLHLQPAYQADPMFRGQVTEVMNLYKNTINVFLLLITQFESILFDAVTLKNNFNFDTISEKLRAHLASIMPVLTLSETDKPGVTPVEAFNAEFTQQYDQDSAAVKSITSEIDTLENSSGCPQFLPGSDINGTLTRFKKDSKQIFQKIVPIKNAQLRYQQIAAKKLVLLNVEQNRRVIELDRQIKFLEERLTRMSSLIPRIVDLMSDLEKAEAEQKKTEGITTIGLKNENDVTTIHKAFKLALDGARKKYDEVVKSMIPQNCQLLIQNLKQQINAFVGVFNSFDKLVIDYWNKNKKKFASGWLSYIPYAQTISGDWPYNALTPIP